MLLLEQRQRVVDLRPSVSSERNGKLRSISSRDYLPGLAILLLSTCFGTAQILTLTNGVHTFPALTNTTIVMSGRSELRLSASTAPLSGCLVHLNSPDAWIVLPAIKPSAALAYLGQLRVNGTAAVADSNIRVVQYAMGSVILPHPANLQPLQVYSLPHFMGVSSMLGQYTAYDSAGLGAMNKTISSFKLKRGYMATLAENENGTGASQCYVAQDGDLEVTLLSSGLDDKVSFVRVFPWRWSAKKGVAGNIWTNLNVRWFYNWNLDQNSSRDLEYVAIRQTRWWPSMNQDWQTRGINHLLGYNEPDRPDQANLAVGDAIWSWPDLLGTGLRVGAPAVSDGGLSWLYSFIDEADAAGLRVDYVPVHYYRCYGDANNPDGAATQFYNFLKGVYDRVRRPLWVTEWNNGANWTACADPTFEQQQATVAKMIEMLDNTPFVERYAIYNKVEDVRRVVWDDGWLTSAGVTYRDKLSPLAYQQALPDNNSRSMAVFRLEGDTLDSSGFGNNAMPRGHPAFTSGYVGQALEFDGTNSFLQLPPNIAKNAAFTFAAWVNWGGGGNWQRIFDFGNDTSQFLYLTARNTGGNMRFAIKNGGSEQALETSSPPVGEWQHVAVTLSGTTARLYTNGVQAAAASSFSILPSSFSPQRNYLGESQFAADPMFKGKLDEVIIADYALSASQVAGLMTNMPPQFTTALMTRPNAQALSAYTGTITGSATDPNPGETLVYSKVSGPAWLTVASSGALGGTPAGTDVGTNTFTVRVTDRVGVSAFAVLLINVPNIFNHGTWVLDANGFWGTNANWSGGVIANGAGLTANFGAINITGNRALALDSSRHIGTLRFGDTSGAQSWTLGAAGGSVLTLSSGTSAQPAILVTNTATLVVPLAGTNGLIKSGPGTLVLSGNNSLMGTLNIDSGSSSAPEGAVRIAGPAAVQGLNLVQIRNNNSGSSTLQLDGTAAPIVVPAIITASCRNTGTPTIQNLAGTNTLAGFVRLESGGTYFNIQSDSGLLVFARTNQYVGSLVGGRTYAFSGSGHHLLSGPLLNPTNGSVSSVTKSGSGSLTLAGTNTHAGSTMVTSGTLIVNGSITTSPVTLSGSSTLAGTGWLGGLVTLAAGGVLSPGLPQSSGAGVNSLGTLTLAGNLTLQPGSMTRVEISRSPMTNDLIKVGGEMTLGGSLLVTNISTALQAGDTFQLFQAGTVNGAFGSVSLPALNPGLGWDTTGLVNGKIQVIQTTAAYPTNLALRFIGNELTLSWPATHTGWRLQAQTNSLGQNWSDIPGSETVNEWILPVAQSAGSVFFRLVLP